MSIRKIHYISGMLMTIFITAHLINHTFSLFGPEKHIEVMNVMRVIYRNIFVESILLIAVITQIYSGLRLYFVTKKNAAVLFEKVHIWSGLYLAIFLIIHVSAVFGGRLILDLDTNFYFGVAGLNTFPFSLFFIPYYGLAIVSFFGHIAAIHHKKMGRNVLGIEPKIQSNIIIILGFLITFLLFYGLTNRWEGVVIPAEYRVLIGR